MKIGIISDIHDGCSNLLRAVDILNQEKVKRVYFCGDLVSPFTLKFFRRLKAPVKAVFGNNEGDKLGIIRRIDKYNLQFEYGEKQRLVFEDKIGKFNLVVYHGDTYPITQALLVSPQYNLVLTGHDHLYKIKKLKDKLWINPGTVGGFSEKITNKPTFALFDTDTEKAKIIHL